MRILCLIPGMGRPGGAERMMTHLVSHFSKRHSVILMTLEHEGMTSFFPLPETVQQIALDKLGGHGLSRLWRVISRFPRIRQEVLVAKPDVVVSFMDTMNMTALISCFGLDIPVIVSERNDPALHRIGLAKEIIRDCLYHRAHIVVVQTPRVASYFRGELGSKIRIIANAIPPAPVAAKPDRPNEAGRFRIVSVGRLAPHKGFDRLIHAFASLARERPDWDLMILGEGPERQKLEALVQHHNLRPRIYLPGTVRNVYDELAASHVMAFPSEYEGFPNALAEGLASGLPAVAHSEVSGVEELIINGKTGILVGRGTSLAAPLSALMDCPNLRRRLGEAARSHVAQWNPSRILGAWETAIAEMCRKSDLANGDEC